MSLPSKAIFWKDDKPIATTINKCGWWFEDHMIPELLKDLWDCNGYPPDYDCVTMYDCRVDKEDVINIGYIEQTSKQRAVKNGFCIINGE